jgi:hypothetical protein
MQFFDYHTFIIRLQLECKSSQADWLSSARMGLAKLATSWEKVSCAPYQISISYPIIKCKYDFENCMKMRGRFLRGEKVQDSTVYGCVIGERCEVSEGLVRVATTNRLHQGGDSLAVKELLVIMNISITFTPRACRPCIPQDSTINRSSHRRHARWSGSAESWCLPDSRTL